MLKKVSGVSAALAAALLAAGCGTKVDESGSSASSNKSSGTTASSTSNSASTKTEGGFPETKVLKQKVRDCIEPNRGLGHSDKPSTKAKQEGDKASEEVVKDVHGQQEPKKTEDCEDCK